MASSKLRTSRVFARCHLSGIDARANGTTIGRDFFELLRANPHARSTNRVGCTPPDRDVRTERGHQQHRQQGDEEGRARVIGVAAGLNPIVAVVAAVAGNVVSMAPLVWGAPSIGSVSPASAS